MALSKKDPLISVIILVNPQWFNDLKLLPGCLESIQSVDEIVLVISEANTQVKKLAEIYKAKIVQQQGGNFPDWRNLGAQKAKGKWLFYIDTDEQSSKELNQEIIKIIQNPEAKAAYAIPRSNKILGKEFRYGGWWPDYVMRLMQKDKLEKWEGDLHEQPKIKGETGYLKQHLVHIKFQQLEDYLDKTIHWSQSEAKLMQDANLPRLNSFRFIRLTMHPFLTSLFNRLIIKKGILDGTEGLIDAIYQSYSQFISYARLWELQLNSQISIKN